MPFKSKEEAEKSLKQVIEELKPIVAKIEAGYQTTKGHYAQYMGVLSVYKEPSARKNLAACLILAGANKEGVRDALKICNGEGFNDTENPI